MPISGTWILYIARTAPIQIGMTSLMRLLYVILIMQLY